MLIKHSKASEKRLSTTCWSLHFAAVKLLAENFDGVVAAIEKLFIRQANLDTGDAAQNLMPAV